MILINQVNTILKKYNNINYAFLFGSCLKGNRKDGDIDILISGELDFYDKVKISSELEIQLKKQVDLVTVEHAPDSLVLKAFSTGKPIIVNNKNKLKNEYLKNFYHYDLNTSLRKIKKEKLIRDYSHG